jgi:hypothetical protein
MTDTASVDAHKHSIYHRNEIEESDTCGCFHCMKVFPPAEIKEWTDKGDPAGETAVCPKCGIDAVIGSASGFPIEKGFLQSMNRVWF